MGVRVFAPVEETVFVDKPRPITGGQVRSIASPPILTAEDLQLRSPAGLESPPMSILKPYWKDDLVFQTSSPMTDDPSRPLQSGTSDELGRSKLVKPCLMMKLLSNRILQVDYFRLLLVVWTCRPTPHQARLTCPPDWKKPHKVDITISETLS